MTQEEILTAAINTLIVDIIARSEAEGQRASGATYATLKAENVSATHAELWGATYIGVLEDGRKPGNTPKGFVEIIKEWAQVKGIAESDPEEFEKWARAVAWKIKREGTKLYREGGGKDIFITAIETLKTTLKTELEIFYKTAVVDTIRTAWNS